MRFFLFPRTGGVVDVCKVGRVIMRYRLIFLWVILANLIFDCVLAYGMFLSMPVALGIMIPILIVFGVSSRLRGGFCEVFSEKEKLFLSSALSTPQRKETLLWWSFACRRAGFRSGGVHFVVASNSFPDRQFRNVLVRHASLFSRQPILFVCDALCQELSSEQLCAVIEHECGHLRFVPECIRVLMKIVSLPSFTFFLLLCALSERAHREQWAYRILFAFERILYRITVLAALHAEEYAADAYVALEQMTTTPMIAVLTKLYWEDLPAYARSSRSVLEAVVREGQKESHRFAHPHPYDRILRLEALHRTR